MNFPLYDNLIREVENKELTNEQKIDLIRLVNLLDQKGKDIMFTLIRVHGLKMNSGNIFDIPFGGETINTNTSHIRDIKFNVVKLPFILSQIIYRFAQIHSRLQSDL
jgi:hypothetical protein